MSYVSQVEKNVQTAGAQRQDPQITKVTYNSEKDYRILRNRPVQIVIFIIIFVDLMKNRISSEYVPRMKVIIFTDFMYYCIVIIEKTQAQYFESNKKIVRECSQQRQYSKASK